MEEKIKGALLVAGFDCVGITTAEPLIDDGDRLRSWLEQGHAGHMEYMGRNLDLRSDPARFFDGARSVIVTAGAYGPPRDPEGPVAAFGLCRDYHALFFQALEQGMEAIAEVDGSARSRVAVDAAPLLERALACRAGLGRIGYSSSLITPAFGPFVHLGLIVTTLALKPDAPAEPGEPICVSCGRCMEACPTGALKSPYLLDARKCISYLTIEKKGAFTDREAEAIGGWAFGCDICTRACLEREGREAFPKNAGKLLNRNLHMASNDLENLLDLCESGFKKSFRGSPLFRCGKGGLIRNVLTAAKNRNLDWVAKRAEPHLEGGTEASRAAAKRAVSP